MLALVPYQVDVGMSRWPIANFCLIGIITTSSVLALIDPNPDVVGAFVLRDWSLPSMVGHLFFHGGFLHLIGNMVFLWTFGNAVCAKVGNWIYIPLFIALGLSAATVHNLLDARPAIGASGAINGIVGMYLVFFPTNNVTCAYWFFFRVGTFYMSGIWIILLFLAFDLWGVARGGGSVAYWAHLGGFATGAAVATTALLTGMVEMRDSEDSLLKVLGVTD